MISSARYTDLYDYTRTAEQIDYDLISQADRLISRLSYFEATCRESGFSVWSDGLGSALRAYAVRALPIDQHVRTVGEGFQRADGNWIRPTPVPTPSPIPAALRSLLPAVSLGSLLGVASWLVDTSATLARVTEVADFFAKFGAGFFIRFNPAKAGRVGIFSPSWTKRALSLTFPHKVPGRIGVSAPKFSRWAWGLDARYAKFSTVANTMFGFRHALTHVGIISAIAIIPASVKQIKANAQQYALDPLGMVVANVIDLEFIAATSIIGAAGGAKIGSVAGGVIGGAIGSLIPVAGTAAGAAVGAFIGGVVGGAVGGWGAGKLQDAFIESETHDNLINGISQKGNQIVDSLGVKSHELGQLLDTKAHELVDFADTTVDEVAGFLNTKGNELSGYLHTKAGDLLNGDELAPAI